MAIRTCLKNTQWLAGRLGLSVTTVERMRTEAPNSLPPHIKLGSVYRYDVVFCEWWLQKRLTPDIEPYQQWSAKHAADFYPQEISGL